MNSNKDTYDEETIDKAKSVAKSFINANFKEVTTIECGEPFVNINGLDWLFHSNQLPLP